MKREENKKYTPKYFKDGLPEWKRIKDPFTSRIFYRPLSFITASIATRFGLTANTISYFSIFIAIFACISLIIPNYIINIIGAILVNLWLLSDCTDGNIARTVKKQIFGDFADSVSSYILVGLLCTSLGICTYFTGGAIIDKGCIWIVLLGAIASSSDTLMRLVYQKYKNSEKTLVEQGIITPEEDKRTDNNETNSLIVRIESDFGIGGILPILVLLGTIFKMNDLVVIYCFAYYFLSSIVMIMKYIRRAIKKTKENDRKEVKY